MSVSEKYLNWTGLLIEPALSKQTQCVVNRNNSRFVRAGLVAFDGPRHLSDPGGNPKAGAVEGDALPAYPLSELLDPNVQRETTSGLWTLRTARLMHCEGLIGTVTVRIMSLWRFGIEAKQCLL